MTDLMLAVEQTRNIGTIGASDAATALGLNQYDSPLTLWQRLRGMDSANDKPAHVQEAAEFGHLLEPVIRGVYAVRKQVAVYVPKTSTVKDGWLHATADGLVVVDGEPGTYEGDVPRRPDGLVQIKNRSAYKADEWLHGVPAAEEVQCRVEMAVHDLPWNDCGVLIGGNRMLIHRVERDAQLEDNILRDLRAFWDLVQSGTEPPVDASVAWREFASSRMRPSKVFVTPDDEMRDLVNYWLANRAKAKKAEEEADAAKTDILLRLSAAGATGIDLGGGRKVTAYKVGGRTDWKGIAASLGCTKAPDKFKTEGKTWTLRGPSDDE